MSEAEKTGAVNEHGCVTESELARSCAACVSLGQRQEDLHMSMCREKGDHLQLRMTYMFMDMEKGRSL